MTDWKRRYEDEFAIVDRVWLALGIKEYEDANGKSIDQIVAKTVAENARLRAERDEAVTALKAYDEYDATPADRGGKSGPKGLAFAHFVELKGLALAKQENS